MLYIYKIDQSLDIICDAAAYSPDLRPNPNRRRCRHVFATSSCSTGFTTTKVELALRLTSHYTRETLGLFNLQEITVPPDETEHLN